MTCLHRKVWLFRNTIKNGCAPVTTSRGSSVFSAFGVVIFGLTIFPILDSHYHWTK